MVKVSVIIPNFNGKRFLKDCLDSVLAQDYGDFEVILVDNGSKDGSVMWMKENYPEVRTIALQENTGFCGGVNTGIKASDSEYVFLLNNDTIVQPGAISALMKEIESRPEVFSCQAKMLKIQDHSLIDDAGNYYCVLGWAYADGKGKPEQNYKKVKEVFSACAGAAVYRRSILDEIGIFDEEHFAYLEDMDLGYRARLYGYKNIFCPDARILHVGSGTTGSRYNLFKVRYSSRNNVYLIYKNMPWWQILLNSPFFLLGFGAKAVFFALKGFGKEYLAGIKNGFLISMGNRERKVDFRGKGLRCLKIEGQLLKYTVKRFLP